MKEVEFEKSDDVKDFEYEADEYFLQEGEDGILRCSCGRELIQLDAETWKCPGGYPTYRINDGSVMIDKFGRLMFKHEDHDPPKN